MVKSVWHIRLTAAIIILSAAILPAAAQQRTRVLGLNIVGNEATDAGLIRAHSGLTVGQDITGDDVQSALQQLWKLNLFSDVQILEEKTVPDGVFLAIQVKEYPRLERVDVHGNKKLKGDDLNGLIKLTKGQVVPPRELILLRNRLVNKYAEMGYLLADVTVNGYRSETTGRQIVDVQVKEGKKVRIKDITFEGNTAFSDRNLRGKMKENKRKAFLRSGEFKRDKLDEDKQAVVDFYTSKGYRDAEILKDSVYYSDDRKSVYLRFDLAEGQLYHYGNFTWSGNKVFNDAELAAKLRVAKGDLYNAQKFQQSLQDVGTKYYEKGYIRSRIVPAEKVRDSSVVDVNLAVEEGNQFKVNRVTVNGNTKTKEKVVRRELVLFPGETFDVAKLERSIREVTILNYFEKVEPQFEQDPNSDNQVNLNFAVKEKSTDQANVSAGYSQNDGFIGSVGFQMNNLLGNGQQLALNWDFGKVYRRFSVSFTEPWFRNTRTLVGGSFYDTHSGNSVYGFDEDIIGGELRLGRRLRWPDDYFRADYTYALDRTEYSNFTDAFRASNPRGLEEKRPRISSGLTQAISRDSRNNPEFPTKGSVNVLRAQLVGGPLGGNDQYVKLELQHQWYVPLMGQLVLAASANAGALDGLTRNPHDIPYFDYFFMGGAGLSLGTALRGYDEREVGPQSGGYAVGGKTLFKESVELRYPVLNNPTVFLLTFAEAGNVWRSFNETNLTDVRRSVGLGVRLFLPFIGMIGLDYGLGLDYVGSDGHRTTKWVPHFQFGRGF
jgi:outer membrane protein insertion porin family